MLVQVERLEERQAEFQATLTSGSEVPPVETDASGEASFEIEDSGESISYEVTVSDIEDVVGAHIHCGSIDGNGPVGVTLFDGGPVSEDGTLAEGTITEPDSGNSCGWESMADVVAAMLGEDTYVNVHTEANPSGEVRGQIRYRRPRRIFCPPTQRGADIADVHPANAIAERSSHDQSRLMEQSLSG